jgi:valyl-tRNA synthetase
LSTAREIITLWVARMVMTGLYNIGDVPFKDVVIHPVIQDGQGRKMSKTLGNGVDPVDIIDKYGADALRFTLAELATETQDIRMPVKAEKQPDGRTINTSEKFEKGRNFCNKLWQASTGFVFSNLEGYAPAPIDPSRQARMRLEDRWILSRLAACTGDVSRALDNYRFSEAAAGVYRFMWDEYCSWYIEMSKARLSGEDRGRCQQVLVHVLDQLLRLLHPFVPFVTEALWEQLNAAAPRRGLHTIIEGEQALVAAAWPTADEALRDPAVEAQMELMQSVIRGIRDIRMTVNDYRGRARQPALKTVPSAIISAPVSDTRMLETNRDFLLRLAGCDAVEIATNATKPAGAMSRLAGSVQVFVPVADFVDLAEVRRDVETKRDELKGVLAREQARLSNEGFVSRADPAVVEQARQRAADLEAQVNMLSEQLSSMQ